MIEAIQLAKTGAYEEALKVCKKIESKNINNAVYYNVLGIVYRRLGLLDEAYLSSERAIQLDEGLLAAKMNIAKKKLQKKDIGGAIELLEQILSEEPSYEEARANLALAYKSTGKIEKSLNVYKDLKFVSSGSQKARFNYGLNRAF